jgi:hypothetical protein
MQREKLFLSLVMRDGRVWAAVGAALLLVLPILSAQHLNVVDGPGHVARLAVLHQALAGEPSPFYDITSFFLPNIAFDMIGLGLAWFTDAETAARIFLALTLVLTMTGAMALNRVAIGRWSVVPVAVAFFAYNLVVVEGFFNYAFGLALVPWAIALRLKLEKAPLGLLAGAIAGIVLLFCHLFAFGIYGAMSFGLALSAWRAGRIARPRFVLWMLEFAPALLLLVLMPHDPSSNVQYAPYFIADKLAGIFKSISSGSLTGDIAFCVGMAELAAAILLGRARLAPPLIPGLILLVVIYLALPDELGHGSYVDKRLPIAIGVLLVAGIDAQISRTVRSAALAAIVAAALVVKQGAVSFLWHRVDPVIDSALTAMSALPAGAVIFRVECRPANTMLAAYVSHQPAMTHLPALATLDGARFDASGWAIPGQQPIAVRPEFQRAYNLQSNISWSVCLEQPLRHIAKDIAALGHGHPYYLFVIRPARERSLPPEAVLVSSGHGYELYRVSAVHIAPM